MLSKYLPSDQQLLALLYLILVLTTFINAQRSQRVKARSCSTISIPNASVRFKHNNKIMRINCVHGFVLQGSNIVGCENGKWNSEISVCAKDGCPKLESPENGLVLPMRYKTNLYCKENYKLVGGRVTYCNGTHWDRPLGTCQKTDDKIQFSCSFETDDLCGWSHDETHNFDWKRVMAANMFQQFQTGPQFDHTTLTANSGHYMLMESFDQPPHSVARLISPIYSARLTKNYACFKFYYFMYGAAVGNLSVYVKPVTLDIENMVQEPGYKHFSLSGNQGSVWKEAMFIIKQILVDFQIVVEGTAGTFHLSDIAIDDVRLMPYSECVGASTTELTIIPDITEYSIYDVQSCEGRCNENNISNYGIKSVQGTLLKTCDCYPECESLNTCCPNYRSVCEFGTADSSTLIDSKEHTESSSVTAKPILSTSIKTPFVTQWKKFSTLSKQVKNFTSYRNFSQDIRILTSTAALKSVTKCSTTLESTEDFKTNPSDSLEHTTTQTNTRETTFSATTPSQMHRITPNIITISENIIILRKNKLITWQIRDYTSKQGENLCLFILTVLVLSISITVLIFKQYEQMKKLIHFCFKPSKNESCSEVSSLIYNQRSESIVSN